MEDSIFSSQVNLLVGHGLLLLTKCFWQFSAIEIMNFEMNYEYQIFSGLRSLMFYGHVFSAVTVIMIFFSSRNLSRRRLDVYHTSTHGVALVRI